MWHHALLSILQTALRWLVRRHECCSVFVPVSWFYIDVPVTREGSRGKCKHPLFRPIGKAFE
jgi:hypothetical protein